MFRTAQIGDREAFCRLWQQSFGDAPGFSGPVFDTFAGPQNIHLSEEAGQIQAILCAVPVTLRDKKGAYFYGLATRLDCRGQGIMTRLMEYAEQALRAGGGEFVCLIPASASLFDFYAARGYQKAFSLRQAERPIRRNLWAVAEFDAVTAKALQELRRQYAPDSIRLSDRAMALVLGDLYSAGLTIVSDAAGYGLYFQHGDTLKFIELFAKSDPAAERLLEVAREKTGAEKALLILGGQQSLFLGEGVRQEYGMIHFLHQPFDVSESYMRLMLDNEE